MMCLFLDARRTDRQDPNPGSGPYFSSGDNYSGVDGGANDDFNVAGDVGGGAGILRRRPGTAGRRSRIDDGYGQQHSI